MAESILLVEEDPDDRALTERELQPLLGTHRLVVVADQAAFERALDANSQFSAFITDFVVGWNDPFALLNAVRRHSPNCGALLFALSGSEDDVLGALKRGFDDYVPKSMPHRARLVPAVSVLLRRQQSDRIAYIEAEQRYRALLDDLPMPILRAAPDGRIIHANSAAGDLLLRSIQELATLSLADLHVEQVPLSQWHPRVANSDVIVDESVQLKRSSGQLATVRRSVRPVLSRDYALVEYEVMFQEQAQHTALARTDQVERRFEALLEAGADFAALLDERGHMRYVAPSVSSFLGYAAEHLVDHEFVRLVHPADAEAAGRLLQGVASNDHAQSAVLRLWRSDGGDRAVEVTMRNLLRDTAVRAIVVNGREARARASALTLEGGMQTAATGMLQDLGSLLETATEGTDTLLKTGRIGQTIRTRLEEVKKVLAQAVGLGRQLVTLTQPKVGPQQLDLNAIIRDMEVLMRKIIGKNVDLVIDLDESAVSVFADIRQLEQALIGIAIKARETVPEGGKLVIRTQKMTLTDRGPEAVPPRGTLGGTMARIWWPTGQNQIASGTSAPQLPIAPSE